MMEELIGFVMGNKHRIKVLEIIESKGPQPAEKIAKFGRLTAPSSEGPWRRSPARGF